MSTPSGESFGLLDGVAKRRSWLADPYMVVVCIAAVKFGLHLYSGRHYGYFVDELYYIACSDHLDWGYVDQPPLIALLTKFVRLVLGDSLPAIRFLPALAGVGTVLLTGLLARELEGGRFAQGVAALAPLVAPGFLATDNLLSMNAFEPLFWGGSAYMLIRIIQTGDQKLWLWFGLVAGVGLQNKHSMLIFGLGIVAGLLLTPERRFFRTPWIWIGAPFALMVFLPNLLWNIHHHFPRVTREYSRRRPEGAAASFDVFLATDIDNASPDLADLVGGALALPVL